MADEIITAPVTPVTTESAPEVSKPLATSKPYDDDMLSAYEAESKAETASEPEKAVTEQEKVVKEEVQEETKPEEPNKATKDDKVIDGVEELPITRSINGKEVEFKVKDAIQAFVKQEEFNRTIDKRLAGVAFKEKNWQKQEATFKANIVDIIEKAQSGDFVTPIKALAKLAVGDSGLDPIKFEKTYFEQLEKINEVYTKMSPDQQEAFWAKRAAAEAKAKASKLEEEKASQTAQSQLQEKVTALQQQHGLQEAEFWSNYKVLVDNYVGEGKNFQSADEIQSEDVVRYCLELRHETKVVEAAKEVGVTDDADLDEISKVLSLRPETTVPELVKLIKDAGWGNNIAPASVVENLNRKAQKSNGRSQVSSAKKENGKIEGLDKEDLDFLYRKQPRVFSRPVR